MHLPLVWQTCDSAAPAVHAAESLHNNYAQVSIMWLLQQNITLVKRTVLHMNAPTVFVFVKYPPTAVPILLDDVGELVTSQQLPGAVL